MELLSSSESESESSESESDSESPESESESESESLDSLESASSSPEASSKFISSEEYPSSGLTFKISKLLDLESSSFGFAIDSSKDSSICSIFTSSFTSISF
ncbi:unnamed protein product [[Candida] boidinii]|nr:unnamed protein product [[Candida] boidinii]